MNNDTAKKMRKPNTGSFNFSFFRSRNPFSASNILLLGFATFAPAAFANYTNDWEDTGNKGGYASGNLTANGIEWNLTEALATTGDANDWKNGTRSARGRGYGASVIVMTQNKTNGLGYVTFGHRRYGTDAQVAWVTEYSTNSGSSWTQIGSAFTPGASVGTFSNDVNVTGDVRIRIRTESASGTSNRRANFDDILLTDYAPASCGDCDQTVDYVMQTGNFNQFRNQNSTGGWWNETGTEIGMWANGGGGNNGAAGFQTFTTTGVGGSGDPRPLQIGDEFTITTYSQNNPWNWYGISFNDSTTYSSFSDLSTGRRMAWELGSAGNYYVIRDGGNTGSDQGPGADRTLKVKITASDTFTATIGSSVYYDLPMLGSPGPTDRIESFAIYVQDDNGNKYWKNASVHDTGAVEFGGDNGTRTIAGRIADGLAADCDSGSCANRVYKIGTGTITFSDSSNSYSGGTQIEAGTLTVSADGQLGAAPGSAEDNIEIWSTGTLRSSTSFTLNANRNVVLGATSGPSITVASGTTLTYGGIMKGAANWNKKEAGTLRLTTTAGENTGKVDIQAGTLQITGDRALGAEPGSAAEKINIWSTGTFEADGTFTLHANRSIELGAVAGPVISVSGGNTLTYGGAISGSANWSKNGTGKLSLTTGHGYTGALTINSGSVRISSNTGLGTTAGGVTVASGAALEVLNNITVGAEALNLSGTGESSGGALRNISGNNTYQGLITLGAASRINSDSGTLTLDPTSGNAISGTHNLTLGGDGNITVNDPIATSTGTLTKDGSGTATLAAVNTFSGTITINAGILAAANNSALGTTAGGVSVTAGAVLSLSGGITIGNESLTLNGTGISSGGGLRSVSGDNFYNGAISLASASSVGVDANSLSLGGAITGGNSLTKVGAGTLILTGTNTYGGGTTVSAGTLQGNTTSLQGNIVNNAAVLITQTFDGTYAGAMSGSGTLTKQGSGVVTLTGASSHSGGTTISAGTLVQNGTNANSAVTVSAGTTLMGGGEIGNLIVSGTVRPGNSASAINRLRVASLTMNNGSSGRFKIGDASVSTDRDYILNDGSATINATTTIYIDDSEISNWDNTQSGAWNLIMGGISDASNFSLDDSTYWSSALGGGSFSLAASSGNLTLVFTAAGGAPSVTTDPVSEITTYTAKGGGEVTADGGDTVTERGVVWNTGGLPTTADNKHAADAGGVGVFTNILTGLTPGQTYYVRAYAINVNGTGYGLEESFTADCFGSAPVSQAASSVGYTNFTANWDSLSGAVSYRLDVSTDASFGGSGLNEDFTDGNFTADPTWSGDTGSYSILTDSTLPSGNATTDESFLGSDASVNHTALTIASAEISEWRFSLGSPNFSPSSANHFGVILMSDTALTNDITAASWNGYYLRLGVDGSTDYLELWRSSGGTKAKVGDYSAVGNFGGNALRDGLDIRITRNGSGEFTLYYDTGFTYSSTPSNNGGTLTNSAHSASSYFGVYTRFANAATSRRVYIDNISLGGGAPDYVPGYSNRTVGGISQVVTGLVEDTTYYYRVRAVGAGSCVSPDSTTQTVTTLAFTPPGIGINPNLAASSTVGSNPSSGAFVVTNIGQRLLSYMITSNVSWLGVTPVSGTNIAAAGTQSHTVNYNVSGMTAGVYTGIITVTGTGAGGFAATNSPQEIEVVLTLTAIPAASAATVTADGNEMIRLAWTKHGSHDVMITYRGTNAPAAPTQGASYNVGDAIGGGGTRVLYKGAGSALEHVVAQGVDHYYAFYSINNNHYSDGLSDNDSTGEYEPGEIVEPFAYTNGVTLASRNGGAGWDSAWVGDTGDFIIDGASFDPQDEYPTPRANKVRVTPGSGETKTVRRPLDAEYRDGQLYVSFIMNFQYDGPDKFAGLSLMYDTTEKLFVGEVGSADLRFGIDSTSSGIAMNNGSGNDYIVVMRYDWAAGEAVANMYEIGTDTVPPSEPGSWDITVGKASNVVGWVNGIRIAAGAGSGTPGDVYFDEIRVATTWSDLVQAAPSKVIYDGFAGASGSISGQGGGTGWSDTWTLGGDPFVDYSGGSFGIEKSSYYQPTGNKIVMYGDVDGRWISATRNFLTTFTNGVVYYSWMQNYAFNGTDKYAGITLMDGSTEKAFVGKVSSADKLLGVSGSTDNRNSGVNLENGAGQDYVIVARYDFDSRELSATAYKTTEESIAEEPNGYWYVTTTQSVGHITSLSGIRLSIGAGVGVQVGYVYMDEVRVGTNWFEVTRKDGETEAPAMADGPTPRLLYVGTNYNPALNPQGSNSDITITDHDLANTADPLDIAVLWSNSFGVFMTNNNAAVQNIGSRAGRVNPNWDPAVLAGSDYLSIGYDSFFTNFVGFNGAPAVTTYVHSAFNITNSTFDDSYFITMSAENNNMGGGTFAPYNTGDNIPYWRALTVNTALQFFVVDDDPNPPEVFEFTIDGEGGFGDTNLTAGAIAIIGVNGAPSSTLERFSFVVLRPFPAGTIIDFTDCGWDPSKGTIGDWHRITEFHTNRWVSSGNAAVGQVFELTLTNINNPGDQVVIYQYDGVSTPTNDPDNVRFVYAVNLGPQWYDPPIPDNNESSGLYRGLTNAESAVSVPLNGRPANAYYTGTVVGTASDLLLSISDANNWFVPTNSPSLDIDITNYAFNVTGAGSIEWTTLATLSDAQVNQGGYVVTNIARDEYSGLVASNTSYASGPYFILFNTNSEVVVSNFFDVSFANGTTGFQTMLMTGPPGDYDSITLGTVSSLVVVADADNDRINDSLTARLATPVFVYDDDPDPPRVGTNRVHMMLGDVMIPSTNLLQLIAGWNFNDSGDRFAASHGAGTFTHTLAGFTHFGGSTVNLVDGDAAGDDFAPNSNANNGQYFQFELDMSGYEDLMLTFAARRSSTGYDSNTVSYSVNGGSFVDFVTGWTATNLGGSAFGLQQFDFSGVSEINNAESVIIRITLNGQTGSSQNNRFDNFQFTANNVLYFEITDGQLAEVDATNPWGFSVNVYDPISGVARGLVNDGTNMILSVNGLFTNNVSWYSAARSSGGTTSSGSTSMWSYATTIGYTLIGDLFADGESNRSIRTTFADLDNDRPFDTLWMSNTTLATYRIIDDDTNAPVVANIRYTGFSDATKPFFVATNDVVLDTSMIRGNLARRSGTGSNTVWGLSDADLANAGDLSFVFGARDVQSGVSRASSGSTNEVMSFSVGNIIIGNVANYDAGKSSGQSTTNITTTNVWSFSNGFFTEEMINAFITGGQQTVYVTIPDLDDDRPNDPSILFAAQVGYLRVIDDDIRGPAIAAIETPDMPGGSTILFTSFEIDEGWPMNQASGDLWTNEVTSGTGTGTWYGTAYKNVGEALLGTHKGGFLATGGVGQYFQLPPRENPGRLSVAARLSSGETERHLAVERLDGTQWLSLGTNAVTSDSYEVLSWDIGYTGVATLRIVRVGSDGSPGIYIDTLALTEKAVWISTTQVHMAWAEAIDDYSAVDEYRIVAPLMSSVMPSTTNSGDRLNPNITNQIFDITGHQGVLTGYVFAIDNDNDRSNDRSMGNVQKIIIQIDTNPPPAVTDFDGNNDPGEVDDTTSQIKLTWTPKATSAEAAGWRQSDSEPLSPFVSYRIYYAENEDRDLTDLDPYWDYTSDYTDLANPGLAEILITDLTAGFTYSLSMAAIDEAGNLGPMSDRVTITLDIFGITHAFANELSQTVIQWEGRDDLPYDVIYADSTGYSAQVDTMWKLAETVIGTQFVDQGGADVGSNIERDAPMDLLPKWMRFYRVAPVNAWIPSATRPGAASEEVIVAHKVPLAQSNNFIGVSMHPLVNTVSEFFGLQRLPSGVDMDEATKINLYPVSETGDPSNDTIWLSSTGWLDHVNADANNESLPYPQQGFRLYVPYATNLLMVGRVPWTNAPVLTIHDASYNVLSMNLPRPTRVADLGLRDILTPGMHIGQADEIRVMNKGTAPWGQPRLRVYLNTNNVFRTSSGAIAENAIIDADEAIIIHSKMLSTNAVLDYWSGTNYYEKPTILLSGAITAAPSVRALSTIIIDTTNALLRGTVNPNSLESDFWFQYGLTTNYGTTTTALTLPATNVPVNVSTNIYGLTPGARYYFQVVASNALGLSRFGRGSFLVGGGPNNMVYVPGGSFYQGSATNAGLEAVVTPQRYTYTSPFYMDKYEVTSTMWSNVYEWAITNGYGFSADGQSPGAAYPIGAITWYDAVKWCNARSEMEGLTPAYYTNSTMTGNNAYRSGEVAITNGLVNWSANGYRLPTEAEWEKAARGGHQDTRFAFAASDYTNRISHSLANFRNDNGEGFQYGTTDDHPVYGNSLAPFGAFPANDYGLYEMNGNCVEWCWDRYDGYDYGDVSDPRGPDSGANRVRRGGGIGNNASAIRNEVRNWSDPSNPQGLGVGFRTVISAP